MKSLIIFVVAIYGLQALPTEELLQKWHSFKLVHGKYYGDAIEDSLRKEIFLKNLQHIEEHNEKFEKGLVSYKIGINKFADMTEEEMRPFTHGLIKPKAIPKARPVYKPKKGYQIPVSKDWREAGIIPPVKNQKGCGSCWAFSANGALESHFRLYKNLQVSLSEQQLVDCVDDNYGCGGGWMDTAYYYIQRNGGVNNDYDYPYEAINTTCRYNPNNVHYTLTGVVDLQSGNERDLAAAVAEKGPVAVAIDASGDFGLYESGVYYNPECLTYSFSHAVVVIGYGTENGQDYWLVRNSWGPDWGDHGYIKMARNRNNHCGIAGVASYPTV